MPKRKSGKSKYRSWSAYFDETQPEDYQFLGFYEHRSRQTDFVSSFQKESHKLKKDLSELIKSGPDEMKEGARRLENIRRVRTLSNFCHCFFALGG